ncbi:MAG: tetratricopeptide repeat protein [Magnetovibrio sp.]|nr:tetratricopeptide repeat protein [Magnetovibrio sp.]
MNCNSLRIAAVVLSLSALSGCAAFDNVEFLDPNTWKIPVSRTNNNFAELGLAELSKGNNVEAQGYFERALKSNPQDVHALYGLAVMYQNSGQPTRARQLYESIVAMQPRPQERIMVWADKRTQPIVDLASVNMHLLESDPTASAGQSFGQSLMQSSQPNAMSPSMDNGGLEPSAPAGGVMMPSRPTVQRKSLNMSPPPQMVSEADTNIVARFETLRVLLEQGLLTQDEFLVRRRTNVGALLPLTSQPPATGLDRPVPAAEQISSRLHAIGRALEMRALSPAQHTAERSMILDALMPARPASMAKPALRPSGLMEAADAVRRLEMLKEADLITSDEYTKERTAIESIMQPAPPQGALSSDKKMPMEMSGQQAKPKVSGFQPALHLASYRQRKAAERGWAELSRRFSSMLNGMEHRIERVDLGGGKGVFYRLKVGPVPSNNAAKDSCRKLKAKRQYCEPTTINFG